MPSLTRRLENLEHIARTEYAERFLDAQRMFGLPLPASSNINEAVRRMKKTLRAIRALPPDDVVRANEIAEELRNWVKSEHERHRKNEQAK